MARKLLPALLICAQLACGSVADEDGITDPGEGVITTSQFSVTVYKLANKMILSTRPKATELMAGSLNIVLAQNSILSGVVQAAAVEQQVLSPLTNGAPDTTCPYLSATSGSPTLSCRYLVDRAVEEALISSTSLTDSIEQDVDRDHGNELQPQEIKFVKSWVNQAALSGIDSGAAHTVSLLRQMGLCDQALTPQESAFKLGEQQGKALLESTETTVMPTIPKSQCNTDIIASTVLAEAKLKVDGFVTANPLCAGVKPEDITVAVDLLKAEKNRQLGLEEGMRQAYEALRVRLVSTWVCDPCKCYVRNGGSGPKYCFFKSDLQRQASSPYWMGSAGYKCCQSEGCTIEEKTEEPCHGYPNNGWGGCCGDELPALAQEVAQCTPASTDGPPVVIGSPLVVDLDGDGVRLGEKSVPFDLAATGEVVRMPRILGDDALLVLDLDGNGRIDSGAELFGNASSCGAARCTDGLEALARHDSNRDGVIDSHDPVFDRLRLWKDVNHDGQSEAGELSHPGSAGIRAIRLRARLDVSWTDASGNSATRALTFERTDGSTGLIPDVWFSLKLDAMPADPRTTGVVSTLLQRLRPR